MCKDSSAKYYQDNIEKLFFAKEKKKKTRQYGSERYKNLPAED